jgi:hypothetical protein
MKTRFVQRHMFGSPVFCLLDFASGAESSHSRPIGWRGQTEGVCRQRDHGDSIAGHVEKLDGVAFLSDTCYDMALDDRPNIPGTESVLDDVASQDHVAVYAEKHRPTSGTW